MPPVRGQGRGFPQAAAVALASAFALVCGLSAGGCSSKPKSAAPSASRSPGPRERIDRSEQLGWLTIRREDAPAASVMAVPPASLPAHVESLYRIRPDRRFLYAAAELERLTRGGTRHGTLGIRFEDHRWRLSLDGIALGDLPEFPDFADAKNFLISRVRRVRAAPAHAELGPAARDALEIGTPAEVFSVLGRLNPSWKAPGDPVLAGEAVRGLLWLSLQTFDELQLTDPILGKALALLAIAEAGAPGRLAREECLLASLLGYEDHARTVAAGLASEDPVRAFAEWDLGRLESLAARSPASPRAQYLYLLRLAEDRSKDDDWLRKFGATSWGSDVGGPSVRLVLALYPFMWRSAPSTLMELRVLEELPGGRASKSSPPAAGSAWPLALSRLESLAPEERPEARLSELEAGVAREAGLFDGPLLDGSVVRAQRYADFYSSVYAAARYQFDRLGSTEGAEQLAEALANPHAGTAAELVAWIRHRVHLRRSNEGVRDVARDLSQLRHIGIEPLTRISYSVAISVNTGIESFPRSTLPGFFEGLDSRPSNLHAAFRTASELLNDLAIMERCMRLSAKRGPRELDGDLPWALRFLGDAEALMALARNRTWPARIRSSAIQQLAELEKTDAAALVEPMRELVREDPSDSGPIRATAAILEKRDRTEEALALIDHWLEAHPDADLARAGVASTKSRLLRRQRRYREAWEIARAAAQTEKAECLEEATYALLDLGRVEDALKMAKRALDHYKSEDEAVLVARILWMQGRDAEAAQLLTSPTRRLDSRVWAGAIPAAFLAAFGKADDARAEAAFARLDVETVPRLNVVWFIEYLTGHGRPELALKLCDRLRGRAPAGWEAVTSYHALLKAKGAAPAREWLKAHATPADLDVAGKQALSERDYELAWDLPDHPDPVKNDILHLIRAVCLLDQPDAPGDRRASLIEYFEARPKKDFVVYGLYFLGRVDRPTLFAQIQDPSYVTSVGWILGVTSAHDGRYEEANSWLQVCMEGGANIPPRYWAADILGRWKGAGCTLSELAHNRAR